MERNPYESPQAPNHVRRGDVRPILVACFYLSIILSGVAQVTRPADAVLHLLLWVLPAWSVTYWCVLDARKIGRPIVQSLHWIIFLTWPVAVPIYLVFSRRLRGLGIALLHAIGLCVVSVLAMSLAWYVVYGVR